MTDERATFELESHANTAGFDALLTILDRLGASLDNLTAATDDSARIADAAAHAQQGLAGAAGQAEKSVDAAGNAAGKAADEVDNVGKSAEKSKGLLEQFGITGKSVGTAIGAGLAGIGAIATKGAIELGDASARFRAETGATQEEAEKAQHAIADLYRTNLVSYEEAGATLAKLRTDLGLTQDQADAAAQSYLTFAKVAGEDGPSAVSAMDDVLDSFNLTADASQGIMDQLVASHQRYGGSIAENEAALAAMAPQLQALNLTLDDGVGLLNLFAASGLDAAGTQRALNSAVANLKPGQNIRDVIADIQAIEDPTQRAAAAMDVFGRKAGVGLANALAPGRGTLADFVITADEVPGATKAAGDAIDSSFGHQAQLALHNFSGALAEAGASFGPLVTGVASLSSLGLGKALEGLWSTAAKSDVLRGIIEGAGRASGEVYVAAVELVEKIAEVVERAWEHLSERPFVKAAQEAAGRAGGAAYSLAVKTGAKVVDYAADLFWAIPGSERVVAGAVGAGQLVGGVFAGAFGSTIATLGLVAIAAVLKSPLDKLGDMLTGGQFAQANRIVQQAALKAGQDAGGASAQGYEQGFTAVAGEIAGAVTSTVGEASAAAADATQPAVQGIGGLVTASEAAAEAMALQTQQSAAAWEQFASSVDGSRMHYDDVLHAFVADTKDYGKEAAAALRASAPLLSTEAWNALHGIPDAAEKAAAEAARYAATIPSAMSDRLVQAWNDLDPMLIDLDKLMKMPTAQQQAAYYAGLLGIKPNGPLDKELQKFYDKGTKAGTKLGDGLDDKGRPWVQSKSRAILAAAQTALGDLGAEGAAGAFERNLRRHDQAANRAATGLIDGPRRRMLDFVQDGATAGGNGGAAYAGGIRRGTGAAAAAARALVGAAIGPLKGGTSEADQGGYNIGHAYVGGVERALRNTKGIRTELYGIRGLMYGDSPPPDPTSPLHTIDEGGWNVADAWVTNYAARLAAGRQDVRRALTGYGALDAGMGYGSSTYDSAAGGSDITVGGTMTIRLEDPDNVRGSLPPGRLQAALERSADAAFRTVRAEFRLPVASRV